MRGPVTTAGEAFRPQQLRAYLALRLGLAQAQRDAAHGAAYGAAHAPFGGDHLLQEIARVHDGAAYAGARNRALLHAGYGSVRGARGGAHVEIERFERPGVDVIGRILRIMDDERPRCFSITRYTY